MYDHIEDWTFSIASDRSSMYIETLLTDGSVLMAPAVTNGGGAFTDEEISYFIDYVLSLG